MRHHDDHCHEETAAGCRALSEVVGAAAYMQAAASRRSTVSRVQNASKGRREDVIQAAACKEWPEAHAAEQQRLQGLEGGLCAGTKLERPRELTRGISVQKKYMQFPRLIRLGWSSWGSLDN